MSDDNETEPRAIDKCERLFADREELYRALRATEDHLAAWVYDLAVQRKTEGIGGATQALERVGKRIDAIQDRMNDGAHGQVLDVNLTWTPGETYEGEQDGDATGSDTGD